MSEPNAETLLSWHWIRSFVFTVLLVGMVAVAADTERPVMWVSVATSAVGFGFFYLLFPGGGHFGIVTANLLAIYGCMFEFFRHTNFPAAPRRMILIALALPVAGFLLACFVRRATINRLIHARRIRELAHLPRLSRWFFATMAVGAATFAIPHLPSIAAHHGPLLIGSMTLITLFIVVSIHDVVLVMVDLAMVFEAVAGRLDRLLMPLVAFLTLYGLLVVVFACLYRIADMTTLEPQFMIQGEARRILFVEALYFSVVTVATVGYGDMTPVSMLVRALAGIEIVCGILMLLFGFSEIMRSAGPDSGWHERRESRREPERDPRAIE
jgi:voltage-gated potassium channel